MNGKPRKFGTLLKRSRQVYTPKDFAINRIVGDVVRIVEEVKEEAKA